MVRLSSTLRSFADKVPKIKLNNGQTIPAFGLGTWQLPKNSIDEIICGAVDVGYRHFDCAYFYKNEKEIGQALNKKIKEGVVKRNDLYITSKLWNTMHKPELVEKGIRGSLELLQMQYLDLYLIHWPFALMEGPVLFPKDKDDKPMFSDVDYVDTWKAMESLVRNGLAKSIGVSNFNKNQIQRVLGVTTIFPVTNQIEIHPYLAQQNHINYCKSREIIVTAYSPLGAPGWIKPDEPAVIKDPVVVEIAKNYKKSPGQVLIKYGLQQGLVVIAKTGNKARLKENIDVWDFELKEGDMKRLNSLDRNYRTMPYKDAMGHKFYPFRDPF